MLPTDPGDRNRTSPFAFTGNRFEFRAPGSGQTIAGPMVMLNTIMAESLDYIATGWRRRSPDGEDFDTAVQKLLTEIITEHGAVVFNGDGYSDDWQIEAAERGLPNLKTTLDALPQLISTGGDRAVRASTACSTRASCTAATRSLRAVRADHRRRGQARWRSVTVILPAALRYQTELAQNVATLKAAGVEPDMTLLEASPRRSPS